MATYNPERRTVLHGMAVLALSLAGCQKKSESPPPKTVAPEAAAPAPPASSQGTGANPESGDASPGGSAAGAPSAAPSGKLSKAQAKYQDQPKGDQQCANCTHFIVESSTCQVVEGQVSPNGWCTLWAKKPG